jgi:hypothetical protein
MSDPNLKPRPLQGYGAPCAFCGEIVRKMSSTATYCSSACSTYAAKFERRRKAAERKAAAPPVILEPVIVERAPTPPAQCSPAAAPPIRRLPATQVRRPTRFAAERCRAMLGGLRHG